ncbi:MAG TPA: FAD-dependent oxidoreductase, partial [Thermoanaerobaculia bacterium]|nr:FAD-dependent oxidoreductase [Thermoanaerobaculia bacterium]
MSDFEDDHDPNGHGFDRRQFGKILVWGVGGLSLAARAGAQSAKPPGATVGSGSYDVIIVGAGLSGLIAARELQRTKLNILMLEAGDRVGGRMFGEEVTANGKKGYIDYGGQWVGPTQTAMLALLDQLGIKKFISYEKGKSLQSWKPDSAKDAERTVFNGDVSNFYMGQCTPPDPHDYPKNALGNVLSSCSAANVPCS